MALSVTLTKEDLDEIEAADIKIEAPDILRILCEQLAADGVIDGKDQNGHDLGSALKGRFEHHDANIWIHWKRSAVRSLALLYPAPTGRGGPSSRL